MTPYFERDGITIFHGDSRELVPLLKADVLITDPPYGVAFAGKNTKHTTRTAAGYTTGDDAGVGPEVVTAALAIVKRGAVFSGVRNLHDYPKSDDIGGVYCPSGAGMGRWGFTCFHPVLFYGKRPGDCFPSSIHSFETAEDNGHPCPKPIGWMRWLIARASLAEEVVLEPFTGSGTTLKAAHELGRRAIGIELEERYCEIAARRLDQLVLPLEMAA